jgi:hypothetical protein
LSLLLRESICYFAVLHPFFLNFEAPPAGRLDNLIFPSVILVRHKPNLTVYLFFLTSMNHG